MLRVSGSGFRFYSEITFRRGVEIQNGLDREAGDEICSGRAVQRSIFQASIHTRFDVAIACAETEIAKETSGAAI